MKLQSIAILIFICLSFSCNQASIYTEDASQTVIIHSPQNIKELQLAKYSEVFDSIKIIPLESPDSALIGRIDKILIYDNRIFILDQIQRKAVFEFDMNGRFIRRFGNVGLGLGEYEEPNDMSVNEKELAIWVNDQRKFVIYDLDGNFLKEVRTGNLAKSGVQIDRDMFALYLDIGADVASGEKFDLKILNKSGKLRHIGFKKKDKHFSKGNFFLSQHENYFLVSPGYSCNIYEINANNKALLKKYEIDFGKYKMPDDLPLKYNTPIEFQKALDRSDYASLSGYWETTDYLIYTFAYKGKIYDAYYSKKTGEIKYGNAWFNNVFGIFAGANKGIYGNSVIGIYDPANIESYQKTFKSPPSGKKLDTMASDANKFFRIEADERKFVGSDFNYSKEEIDMLQSIKTSDNPVILIKKMKRF